VRTACCLFPLSTEAEELCQESIPGLHIDHVDISGLPMANPDLETDDGDGFPPDVEAFRDRVRAADCFIFASPEYNYSITGTAFYVQLSGF
jgi:NAD(P)H-dependent FMN reductase